MRLNALAFCIAVVFVKEKLRTASHADSDIVSIKAKLHDDISDEVAGGLHLNSKRIILEGAGCDALV